MLTCSISQTTAPLRAQPASSARHPRIGPTTLHAAKWAHWALRGARGTWTELALERPSIISARPKAQRIHGSSATVPAADEAMAGQRLVAEASARKLGVISQAPGSIWRAQATHPGSGATAGEHAAGR